MQLKQGRWAAAFVIVLGLSACGGGGGGSSDGTVAVPVPPTPATSGLLPAAPAPGASLHADAGTLRPMRAQARWTYRGVDRPFGATGAQIGYTNVLTQLAVNGGMQEQASNAFNEGPDNSGTLVIEGGTVRQRETLELMPGLQTEVLDLIELRSPVRLDDQYTIYDRRIGDIGSDLDGDKRNDGMDLAIWVRVLGEETLDLPNRLQVRTVKVAMSARLRPVYSGGSSASVSEIVQTAWYAPNLGVVRQQLEMPGESQPQVRRVVTEELLSWDAGDQGLGPTEVQNGVAPAGSDLAGQALPAPLDVVGFDTHAVVLGNVPGQYPAYGVAVTQLDARGRVQAARSYRYAELFSSTWATQPRLLRVGQELKLLALTDRGVAMRGLSPDGQQLALAAPVLLMTAPLYQDAMGQSYRPAAGGERIWLSWLSYPQNLPDGGHSSSLLLQGFDAAGTARTETRVLMSGSTPSILTGASLAASGERLLVSWGVLGNSPAWHYQMLDAADGRLLAQFQPARPATDYGALAPRTLALDTGPALALRLPSSGGLAAARLDPASYALRLGNGAGLMGETLKTDIVPFQSASFDLMAGDGGPLVYGGTYAASGADSSGWLIAQLPAGAEMLSAARPVLLARMPVATLQIMHLLPLGNRVLVIGADSSSQDGKLRTLVVWR